MTFNWHEKRETFLGFLIINSLPDFKDKGLLEELSAATDKFQNVTITMQINGIEVTEPERFVNRLHAAYKGDVQRAAKELLSDNTQFYEAEDIIDSVFKEARRAIRKQFETKLGLQLDLDETR